MVTALQLSDTEALSKAPLKIMDSKFYESFYAASLAIHYFRTKLPQTGSRYRVTSFCVVKLISRSTVLPNLTQSNLSVLLAKTRN